MTSVILKGLYFFRFCHWGNWKVLPLKGTNIRGCLWFWRVLYAIVSIGTYLIICYSQNVNWVLLGVYVFTDRKIFTSHHLCRCKWFSMTSGCLLYIQSVNGLNVQMVLRDKTGNQQMGQLSPLFYISFYILLKNKKGGVGFCLILFQNQMTWAYDFLVY